MPAHKPRPMVAAQSQMRGLIPLPDRSGYQVDLQAVKASTQSFPARGFWTVLDLDEGEFVATFGSKARTREPDPTEEDRFDLAVSFLLTIDSLKKFNDSCWVAPSLVPGSTFAESLEGVLSPKDREWARAYNCPTKLPANREAAMREFPATVVSSTLWNGRGYLEFLEISSEVVRAGQGGRVRENDPVHSIAFVKMSPRMLFAFLVEAKRRAEAAA